MRQETLFRDRNFLYSGDNLRILRYRVADESIDLIYLDPPFNSNQDYNVLFKEQGGKKVAAQIKAFGDTWRWDAAAQEAYRDAVENGSERLADVMEAFRTFLGPTNMLAYLSMMAPRLVELHRALKTSGSIYLHCDPTASHYLKLLMDAVFGPENFRNEIIWHRAGAKGSPMKRLPANHDVILSYSKSSVFTWNEITIPYDVDNLDEKTDEKYSQRDSDGRRYQLTSLLHPEQGNRPNLEYEVLGVRRTWRWSKERMEQAIAEGRVVQTKPGRVPRQKRYLEEQKGRTVGDVWTDISPTNSQAAERLGYPTQKPEALLRRIIEASSNEGDVVLDPFCGCGTSIDAAQRLKRRWVGIDITQVAIDVIQQRLRTQFGEEIDNTYELIRDPASVDDALALAREDKYQFQWWVLDRLGAHGAHRKKGADKGVDGRLNFHDSPTGRSKRVVIQVKGGKTGPRDVRDLRGVMERDSATIGVLVTIKEPTRQMRIEALEAGLYHSREWDRNFQRLQILTVDDLIAERVIDYPSGEWEVTGFRKRRDLTGSKDRDPISRISGALVPGE